MVAGRVHLLYGLAGSGKTTLAPALCADGEAARHAGPGLSAGPP
jgi:adenylylsulfate kinase-like enzyme